MIAATEERELVLGTDRIAYRLHRSHRRTLEISVARGGVVEVRAPDGPPIERIEHRLRARSAWIRRKLAVSHPAECDPPRRFQSGESRIATSDGSTAWRSAAGVRPHVRVHGGRMHVEVRDPGDAGAGAACRGWLRKRARIVIPQRVARVHVVGSVRRASA